MADYFLDTSVLVAYFRREGLRSRELLEDVFDGKATAAVSAITVAELWSWGDMDNEVVARQRQAVLQFMQVVAVDEAIAKRGGAVRRTHGLRTPDALIVACCQHVGGTFYSKDPHFRRVLDRHEVAGEILPD